MDRIVVACVKNVLDPLAEGSRIVQHLPAGRTVAEYVSQFYPSIDRDLYNLSIALNGVLLEGDDRVNKIVPAGSSLVFCRTPRDSDKNPLAILGMLAVLVFAWYASPQLVAMMGLEGTTATIATGVVAGGIIGVGGMVVQTIFPPPMPDFGGMENLNESPTYSWDLRGNSLVEGGAIPMLYGTHRIIPPIISRFVETSGNKQFLNILYGIADQEITSISDEKINDQDIDNYESIITEKRLGKTNQPVIQFFENTIAGTNVQTKIVDTNWVNKTTDGNAVEGLGVVLVLPKGLFYANDNGGLTEQTIKLLIEYKKQGESVWERARIPTDNEIQISSSRWSAGYWSHDEAISTWYELEAGSTNPGDHTENERYYPSDWWDYKHGWTRPAYFWRWVLTDEYVTEKKVESKNYLEITGAQSTPIRRAVFIDNISTGAGTYDVRVAFETTPPSGTRYANEVWWESLQEVVYDDFEYPGIALLGLRALATDQLQGAMPRVSMVATRSTVPVWTGSSYENKPADNPAWVCYDLLHRGGDGVPYSQIDYSAFNLWASWCTTKSYSANLYFDSILSLREALNTASILGRGSVLQVGSKYTAIYDNDTALPTQKFLFTIGNILRNTFAVEYLALDTRANAIELTYFDSTLDYERTIIELYADDFDTTSEEIRKSQITLYGCTDRTMAIKHAKFLLNCNRYITQTATWEADVDAIACVPGDVVEIQHDVCKWGEGGRVVSATSTSVTLDQEVTIEGGKTYHVTVKHQDDDSREERTVTNGAGTYTTLNISTAWTKTPVLHALYSFGETGKLTRQFRIVRIDATVDQRRKITGIEYNASVYSDSATVPSPPSPPGIAVPTNLVANEHYQGGKVSTVSLTWQGYAPTWYVFIREPNKLYRQIGTTSVNHFNAIGLDFGVNYTFAVSSTPFPGDGAEVSLTLNGPGTGVTTPTFDAGSCSFTDRVKLRWGALTDEHLAGYEIRTDLNWGTDTNMVFQGMATYFEMEGGTSSYTFYIKSFNIYGGYSSGYDQVTVTNTAPAAPSVTVRYDDRDILLTWTPPTELDYKETRVQVFTDAGRTNMVRNELATGNNYLYTFAMNRVDYPSPGPNWNVYFRVIHYDKFGSNAQTDPTANNTSPGLPTGCSATGSFKTIVVEWAPPTDIDLDVIEIYRSSSNDSSTATKIGEIKGILFIDGGLGSNETWYYWLKSRDTSGNLSGFCHGQYSGHSATTTKAGQTDLADTLTFIDVVSSLPGSGMTEGDVVYLTTDDKLYRYNGSNWIADVDVADLVGTIPAKVGGVEIVSSLPSLPSADYPEGAVVFLTTDDKLHRSTGSSWTAAVAATDLTGQITETQIGDNEISSGKIKANAIIAGKIATNAVDSDQILANAITAGKINAGAVTADKIDTGAVTALKIATDAVESNKIKANAVIAGKIAAGAVGADEIAANSITASRLMVASAGTTLNADPYPLDEDAWQGRNVPQWVTGISTGVTGPNAIRGGYTVGTDHFASTEKIPIDRNRTYRVSAFIRKSASATDGNCYLGLQEFDYQGNDLATSLYYHASWPISGMSTTFTKYSHVIVPADFNSGTRYVRMHIILGYNTTAGYCEGQDIRVEEVTPGELIVDGAIIADKIDTGAVTANKIDVSTLSAINANMGTLTAGIIQSSNYAAPTGSAEGAGTKISATDGKIEAYGTGHAFGGRYISRDTAYQITIGCYHNPAYLSTRYPPLNTTYYITDGRLHIYRWTGSAWSHIYSAGYDSGDTAVVKVSGWTGVGGIKATAVNYPGVQGSSGTDDGVCGSSTSGHGVAGYGTSTGSVGLYGYAYAGAAGQACFYASTSSGVPNHSADKGTFFVNSYGEMYMNVTGGSGYAAWRTIGVANRDLTSYALADGSMCCWYTGDTYRRIRVGGNWVSLA